MITVLGIYQNGHLKLEREYPSSTPVKVIVTFLEDVQENSGKAIQLSDLSFSKSQKNLENVKGSFSDTIVEERRIEL